jgi:positive regulator of sigma E activity
MPERPFSLTATITLDGTGAGIAQLGPSITNEQWQPAQVSVNCSANVTTGACQCNIYCGSGVNLGTYKDGTFSGDSGDTTNAVAGVTLWPGQNVYAVWSSGVPFASASMIVTGTRIVP